MATWTIIIAFFVVALLYSSVGFGGGSTYIAILLITNLPILEVRYIALICNIVVVSAACYSFYKQKIIDFKSIWPLLFLSLPLAVLGGSIKPDHGIYELIAGISLLLAAGVMLYKQSSQNTNIRLQTSHMAAIGGGIGLLSGFIGIGGGIFLAPLLHLINWKSAKVISAVASFFILFNSIAGLIGQSINRPNIDLQLCGMLALSVFIGGRIGNRLNIYILPVDTIRLLTAILVGVVGIRLIYLQIL